MALENISSLSMLVAGVEAAYDEPACVCVWVVPLAVVLGVENAGACDEARDRGALRIPLVGAGRDAVEPGSESLDEVVKDRWGDESLLDAAY
jgi:hypothetical protein